MATANTSKVDPIEVPTQSQLAFFDEGFNPSEMITAKAHDKTDLRTNHYWDPITKQTYHLAPDFDLKIAIEEYKVKTAVAELNAVAPATDEEESDEVAPDPTKAAVPTLNDAKEKS